MSPVSKIPQPFTSNEIDDAILAGFAQADRDFDETMQRMDQGDLTNMVKALWKQMTPEQKAIMQAQAPEVFKQAVEAFGG